MWAVATARIGGKATPCLRLRGRLYPFPSLATGLPETALGLFAAIPALIAYNKFQGDVAKGQARLESFADEFSSILSRQIDHHLSTERASAA